MRWPILDSRTAACTLLVLLLLLAACGRKGDPHPRSDVHAEAAHVETEGG